jgi:putative transcriptional regulator
MISEAKAMDELLANYAAGRLNPALHCLVASHLVLKPENRDFVSALEELQSEQFAVQAPIPMASLERMIERILSAAEFADEDHEPNAPQDDIFPAPIAGLVGGGFDSVRWKSVLPGLKESKLRAVGETEVSLLWIKPGRVMPSHTHDGTEVTLVLKGGFTDSYGHYGRGDIAIADGDVDHRPRADEGEDCICFVVNDAPLRLTGRVGRLIQRFMQA